VTLEQQLARIAAAASAFAEPDEAVTGVIAAEPAVGRLLYLCSFERGGHRSWLALDEAGTPIASRAAVREAASIAALCELADEIAGGGDLEGLRARLVELRLTEAPEGIEEAEEAAVALERTLGAAPRVASARHLDAVGAASRRLEQALGESARSPFAAAMQAAVGTAEELAADVEASYKLELL
jgi:hypothetical protein